jgi:hypothetical protein
MAFLLALFPLSSTQNIIGVVLNVELCHCFGTGNTPVIKNKVNTS